nr:energy transducer TonB [Alteraurantiacibacter buctensis]
MPDRQGTVTVDLAIDPTGHVAACTVAQSSGNPALDRETCEQMQAYAHYRPALDDAGMPTEDSDTITVEWVFHLHEPGQVLTGPTI